MVSAVFAAAFYYTAIHVTPATSTVTPSSSTVEPSTIPAHVTPTNSTIIPSSSSVSPSDITQSATNSTVTAYTTTLTGTVTSPNSTVTAYTATLTGEETTLSAQPFNFSISSSGGITVTVGSPGSNTITAAWIDGLTESVTLSCASGLPAGASCSFDPESGLPSFASTLTVSTTTSTPAGAYIVNVTGTSTSLSRSTAFTLSVNPGPLDHFTITGYPSVTVVGQSFSSDINVTAYDAYGNRKTDYAGQVYFTSTDTHAVLLYNSTSKYQFVSGDGGTHIFGGAGFILKSVGSQTITVTDGTISAPSTPITVNPAALDHFTIAGYPSSTTAGQAFGGNNIIVTAYDAFDNVKTDYTGQVYFTSTDTQAALPYTSGSKYQFLLGDGGIHTFAGTGFILKTAGSWTITVTDGTISAQSTPITVNAGALDHVVVSPKSATVTTGATQTYTAEAFDAYGNSLGDVSASTSWSIELGAGGSWSGNVYTSANVGTWIVTGTYSGKPDTASLTVNSIASVDTATGTGIAYFGPDAGFIASLTAVNEGSLPSAGKPDLQFPHGFFSFTITGLAPGATVTVMITLPYNVPVGTQYWRYGPEPGNLVDHWHQLPIGDDDGDNVITITLTDNGLGDNILSGADGQIVDPGGPGFIDAAGAPVGGILVAANKLAIIAPYVTLFGVIAAVAVVAVWKRREN